MGSRFLEPPQGDMEMLASTLVQKWKKSIELSIPVRGEEVSLTTSGHVCTPISMLCDKSELTRINCQSNQKDAFSPCLFKYKTVLMAVYESKSGAKRFLFFFG